ncbi:MAG: threonylcarbamoyl-AMP synthase [Deltaproteobacteria bacterium]|nr:threonylcarbamoyl-AMP synthase [Deltaproteobacteria bacterium]
MTPILVIDPHSASYKELAPAAEVLLDGGLVAGPTQSFYALMALADKPEALERLAELKSGRGREQAFLLLLDQIDRARCYASAVPDEALPLIEKHWPGLLTLLLPGMSGLHPLLLGKNRTVGLRVEGLAAVRRLIRMVDRAVTGTSANPHGAPPPVTAAEAAERYDGFLDLIIDGGPTAGGLASTIVDFGGPEPRLIRQGAIAAELVLTVQPSVKI